MQYGRPGGIFGNTPPIVKNLIIINALMLLATELFKPFMIEHFALFYPASPMFKPIQLFTHMFMHGGMMHLFFNMYALWIFGSTLERYWGPKRFLLYYLITGIGAAGFYILVQWLQIMHIESELTPMAIAEMYDYLKGNHHNVMNSLILTGMANVPASIPGMSAWLDITIPYMVGASGAIFGVLLAFGMMFPDIRLQLLFPPIAMKAKWFVVVFGVIELVMGLSQMRGDNVAHFAHLGGMVFGYLMIKYWQKKRRA